MRNKKEKTRGSRKAGLKKEGAGVPGKGKGKRESKAETVNVNRAKKRRARRQGSTTRAEVRLF